MDGAPFAGTVRAEGPGAAYSFRYLSPPWASVPAAAGVYAVIDATAALQIDLAHLPSLSSLPVVLRVEKLSGSADGALASRATTLSPPLPSSASREITTVAGIHGREVSWPEPASNPPVFWREGYFDGSGLGGATFRMQFRGTYALDGDPLIQAMLASFASGTGNQ